MHKNAQESEWHGQEPRAAFLVKWQVGAPHKAKLDSSRRLVVDFGSLTAQYGRSQIDLGEPAGTVRQAELLL